MIDLIVLLVLLALGYGFGSYLENKHYRSIRKREDELANVLVFDTKYLPELHKANGGELISGSVVISVDYFKRFVAGLRLLFGGRLTTYESLLDRGRREAVLRLKEQAKDKGYKQVFNIKFETASISKGAKNSIGSIEVLVYGSAVELNLG